MDHPDTGEPMLLEDGTVIRMGLVHPDVMRFGAVPTWADANPVLSEADCEEHDDFAAYCEPPKTQHFSNCTDASMAWALKVAFRSQGFDVPDLSMSFQYALNNGGRDQGASCRDVAASVLATGKPPASLWPESQIFLPRGGVSQEVKDAAGLYKAFEVYQCMNWADVRSAISRRFLVYHGFVLGQAFISRTGSDGMVPEYDGRRVNGHAMVSRGLKRVNGKLRTITPNTWGPSFGDRGIGYIPESYFWAESGNFVNLDAFAIRAVKPTGVEPPTAHS